MDLKISNTSNASNMFKLKYPDKNTLIEMLKVEEEIRMSQKYIDACNEVKDEINGWLRISEEIQYKIAYDFGYTKSVEQSIAVNRMRTAQYIYPDEPLFKTIPVYVRNNLARNGEFKIGDNVPNIKINNIDTSDILLHDTFDKNKPNLLLCSSHT